MNVPYAVCDGSSQDVEHVDVEGRRADTVPGGYSVRPKATCPVCGRLVALTARSRFQVHKAAS